MVTSMAHRGRSSGWTSFGEDESEEQSLGAFGADRGDGLQTMSLSLPQGAELSSTRFSQNGCPERYSALGDGSLISLLVQLVSPHWGKQQCRGEGTMGVCPDSSPHGCCSLG